MWRSDRRAAVIAAAAVSLQLPMAAAGQGFTVYSHGACAAARGGSGVAAPCDDGSAVFYNPAGLVDTPTLGTGGLNLLSLQATFTPDEGLPTEEEGRAEKVPHLFAVHRISDRLAAGAGVFMPYGLAIDWPDEFRGAFSGSGGTLMSFYLQPTAAFRVTRWLQLGAGVDAVWTSVKLRQTLDLSTVTAASTPAGPVTFGQLGIARPTAFADATLEGTTWSAGWHAGAIVRLTDWLAIGGRYLSEVRNDFSDGEARFDQRPTGILLPAGNPLGAPPNTPLDALLAPHFQGGGPLARQGVATEITLPSQLVLGVNARLGGSARMYADHVWTDWSTYREIPVDFTAAEDAVLIQDYEDTGTLRLGLELDVFSGLVARTGYTRNDPAAPDATVTPLLPDSRRSSFNVGAGTRLWRRVWIDGFASYINQADRRGRLLPRSSRSIAAETLNEGAFSGWAFEGGATVRIAR